MQASNNMQGEANSSHWLDIVESTTVVAAIGGSIAAAVLQEIALASIPLALTATLNLANRRRQLGAIQEQQRLEMSHLVRRSQDDLQLELKQTHEGIQELQSQVEHLTKQDGQSLQAIATLTTQAGELESAITALKQTQDQNQVVFKEQTQTSQTQVDELSAQMADLKNAITYLQSSASDLGSQVEAQQNNSQHLAAQTEGVEELVDILREIDMITQSISANPNLPENFYQRGLIRKRLQRLEDQRIAMEDFSQAINLNSTFANAYFERGLLKSDFGHKQHAVDDLRTAAKFYFDQGDLTQYEKSRAISQEIHDLISNDPSPEEETEQYLLENLFG